MTQSGRSKTGFAGIGRAHEAQLCGTFEAYDVGWATAATALR
jgi:hypothetical protein